MIDSNIVEFIFLCLAVFRIYLEVINFKFESLPITSRMRPENQMKFHRTGLYFCIGYIVLFAPSFLLYN